MFLKKLRLEQPYDPVTPLLGIYSKILKTVIHKDTRSFLFIVRCDWGMEATEVSLDIDDA